MNMQGGGYDYEFVDTPADTLICKICHCPSKEPHLSACCGHTFCKSCLEAARSSRYVDNTCPMCRDEEFITMPNKQADRIIRSLLVYCSNKNKGCEWRGELNDIVGHLSNSDGCPFYDVKCPNDCGAVHQRQYLSSHVETECPRRKVCCQYCHDTGEHQFIEGQHKKDCPKLPLPCPNGCRVDNIPRVEIREHINICPLHLIQCKYHIIGCKITMARKDEKEHNKEMIEKHLSLSITELAATKERSERENQNHREQLATINNTIQEQLAATKISLEKDFKEQLLAFQNDVQKTQQNLTEKLVVAENEIVNYREKFATINNTFQEQLAAAKISLQKDFKEQLLASHNDAQKTVQNLTEKLAAAENEIVALKQRLADNNDDVVAKAEKVDSKVTELETKLHSLNMLVWSNHLFGEATKLLSGVEVLPVVVKMPGFTKKRRDKVQWFSDPFYTHSNGYRIQLCVNPVGNVASYISVGLYILKGPYDGQLQWPMRGNYEVKLLNQTSDTAHHSRFCSVKEKNSDKPSFFSDRNWLPSWFSESFISHEALMTTCEFLKDDNLYFHVSKLSN